MFVSAACFGQNETEQRLRQTISFLASDQLNGRKNGTADADKAADYLKGELKKMGLQVQEYNLALSQLANKQKALQKRQDEDWVKWYGKERNFEVIDPVWWIIQDTSRNTVYQSFFVVIPASGGSCETHLVCANYTGAGVDTVQGKLLIKHSATQAGGAAVLLELARFFNERRDELKHDVVLFFSGFDERQDEVVEVFREEDTGLRIVLTTVLQDDIATQRFTETDNDTAAQAASLYYTISTDLLNARTYCLLF